MNIILRTLVRKYMSDVCISVTEKNEDKRFYYWFKKQKKKKRKDNGQSVRLG